MTAFYKQQSLREKLSVAHVEQHFIFTRDNNWPFTTLYVLTFLTDVQNTVKLNSNTACGKTSLLGPKEDVNPLFVLKWGHWKLFNPFTIRFEAT